MPEAVNIDYHEQNTQERRNAISSIDCPLPAGYQLREIELDDYDKGYLDCLSELTSVGNIDKNAFADRLRFFRARPESYYVFVLVDVNENTIVGCCSLMVEHKIIHGCGKVGHVEDICVHSGKRGLNLGKSLVVFLCALAEKVGCYKTILDCKPTVSSFYAKCGLKEHGVQMSKYYE